MRDCLVDIQDVDGMARERLRERGSDARVVRTADVKEEDFTHREYRAVAERL
jgi:hypothetical protein